FQAEDGIRDFHVTGVQTCALPISSGVEVSAGRLEQPEPTHGQPSPRGSISVTLRIRAEYLLQCASTARTPQQGCQVFVVPSPAATKLPRVPGQAQSWQEAARWGHTLAPDSENGISVLRTHAPLAALALAFRHDAIPDRRRSSRVNEWKRSSISAGSNAPAYADSIATSMAERSGTGKPPRPLSRTQSHSSG